ncbi:MAG: glycosyltransferase family 2 protein [Blastocatellia bacterium]
MKSANTTAAAPEVSVVMPVRNGMPYLPEAVESILGQSFRDFEFLIVDDASTDETPDYLRSLSDHRISIITHKVSQGVARSLNHGMMLAAAPLIARQDADDVSEPDRFLKQTEWMRRRPECQVFGSQVKKINQAGELVEVFPRPMSDAEFERMFALYATPFTHGSVMMRRAAVMSAGGYREQIRCAEDYDLWLRLAGPGALNNHPDVLYRYRVHDEQICVKNQNEASADCWVSRVMYAERACTGEDDSLSQLDEQQLRAIKARGIWRPRGAWARRVRVLRNYAKLLDVDSPRRAMIVRALMLTGGW